MTVQVYSTLLHDDKLPHAAAACSSLKLLTLTTRSLAAQGSLLGAVLQHKKKLFELVKRCQKETTWERETTWVVETFAFCHKSFKTCEKEHWEMMRKRERERNNLIQNIEWYREYRVEEKNVEERERERERGRERGRESRQQSVEGMDSGDNAHLPFTY